MFISLERVNFFQHFSLVAELRKETLTPSIKNSPGWMWINDFTNAISATISSHCRSVVDGECAALGYL